jgi:hypothetical protein
MKKSMSKLNQESAKFYTSWAGGRDNGLVAVLPNGEVYLQNCVGFKLQSSESASFLLSNLIEKTREEGIAKL